MSISHRVGLALGICAICGLAATSAASQRDDGFSIQSGEEKPGELASSYSISVSNAKAKVGSQATITVTVKAGDGFKCNAEYQHKIKDISGGSAVTAPSTVAGSVQGKAIVYSIPVTPNETGDHAVSGEIRFSVCNDSECQRQSVPLSAQVTGQ
jgi:hypothetical protein